MKRKNFELFIGRENFKIRKFTFYSIEESQ